MNDLWFESKREASSSGTELRRLYTPIRLGLVHRIRKDGFVQYDKQGNIFEKCVFDNLPPRSCRRSHTDMLSRQ